MTAVVLAAIPTVLQVQLGHDHQTRVGVGVELEPVRNRTVVGGLGVGRHVFIVAQCVSKSVAL